MPSSAGLSVVEPITPDEPANPIEALLNQANGDFDTRMESMALGLEDEVQGLLHIRERLAEATAAIDEQVNRRRKAIRVLKPAEPSRPRVAASPSPKKVASTTGFGLALDKAVEGAEHIKQMIAAKVEAGEPASVTQKEFYKDFDWDQGRASQLFKYLRSIEFLRFAGKVQVNRQGSKADSYAIMDTEAIDRALAEAEQAFDAYRTSLIEADRDSDDQFERAAAYLREAGEIVGWTTLIAGAVISNSRISTIRQRLLDYKIITAARTGAKVTITYVGDQAFEAVA